MYKFVNVGSFKSSFFVATGQFPTIFSLEIHHGGYFTKSPKRVYNDGKVSWFDQIDADGFSIVEVKSMLAGLGYVNPKMQYCYKIPNGNLDSGLYMLYNDSDVLGLIKHVDKFKLIELYVMHPVDLPKIPEPNEVPNLEDDFDPFFCDLDPENGESSARPKQTDPNDSKQSDGNEESSDSYDSDDPGMICTARLHIGGSYQSIIPWLEP